MTGIAAKALAARNLRIVSRTDHEAEHVHTITPDQKANTATKHATWKFQLLETVNADPMTDPYCVAVLLAYLHFCGSEARTAWMSETELMVRTGVQPRTLRRAKARLLKLKYLVPVRTNQKGIVVYLIDNPRYELVTDHVVIARETMKEREAAKKEQERRRRRRFQGESRSTPPENNEGGATEHGTGGADEPPKSVEQSVESISSERGPSLRRDPWGVYEAAFRPIGGLSSPVPAPWNSEVDA
jgi:hypothetical protein